MKQEARTCKCAACRITSYLKVLESSSNLSNLTPGLASFVAFEVSMPAIPYKKNSCSFCFPTLRLNLWQQAVTFGILWGFQWFAPSAHL